MQKGNNLYNFEASKYFSSVLIYCYKFFKQFLLTLFSLLFACGIPSHSLVYPMTSLTITMSSASEEH